MQNGLKMERIIKMRNRIICLVLSLSIIFGANFLLGTIISPSVSATSAVQFVGGAENFIFYPDGGWNATDLFGGLKNLMPGDKRSESIIVKNTATDYDYVKIYLRADPNHDSTSSNANTNNSSDSSDASTSELLSQLNLNVYQDGKLISSSSAAEPGGLTNNVLLGSFNSGDETMLVAEVSAPENLGNRFTNSIGAVDWFFTAEAYKNGTAIPPDTGILTTTDINGATVAIIITISLILAILIWFCYHKYYRSLQQKH